MERSERAPEAGAGERLAADQDATVTPLLMALDEIEGLRRALESRTVIGQAIGIVMAHERVSAEQGFARLVETSSRTNVKLREVAAAIVAEVEREAGATASSAGASVCTPRAEEVLDPGEQGRLQRFPPQP